MRTLRVGELTPHVSTLFEVISPSALYPPGVEKNRLTHFIFSLTLEKSQVVTCNVYITPDGGVTLPLFDTNLQRACSGIKLGTPFFIFSPEEPRRRRSGEMDDQLDETWSQTVSD
jgi:hypothetical protein